MQSANQKNEKQKRQVLVLVLLPWISFLIARNIDAQPIILGKAADTGQKGPTPNPEIKTDWGPEVDGLSLRVGEGLKSRWGIGESPTFLLQLQNRSPRKRELSVDGENLKLKVDQDDYFWNAAGTRMLITLEPGETRDCFFIIRLDARQWKLANDELKPVESRMPPLPGKKQIQVELGIGTAGKEQQFLRTAKIAMEITQSVFEKPTVKGVLVGQDGQPLKNAEIYLCKDAQFSIYYSGYNGKWFNTKNVSHYDPFGGFSSKIQPVKTDDKGSFFVSPGNRDRRIVVCPPVGSAQVFDLPESFRDWKVQLRKTGKLLIEQDIEGESGTTNASVVSSRPLAIGGRTGKQIFMMTESFNLPLSNGKKYQLNQIEPNPFRLNRYKYVRVGNRSYSIGRMNLQLVVEAGKNTEYRMVRKSGQKVHLQVDEVPGNSQYLVASIFSLDAPINTTTVYGNQTLWSDAMAATGNRVKFSSSLIAPGKYRLVVMSVPQPPKPNQSSYKPDRIGSKIIEVKTGEVLDTKAIRLLPVATWRRNSGMALDVRFLTSGTATPPPQTIWPLNVGYRAGFDGVLAKSDSGGTFQTLRPAGSYRFATGLDQNQATVFTVQVPRMTPQTVILSDAPKWLTEEKEKPELLVSQQFDRKKGTWKIEVNNKGKIDYRPRFGEFQIVIQSQLPNQSYGVRFLPDEDSMVYQKTFAAGKVTRFEVGWDEMMEKGLCTSSRLNLFQPTGLKKLPSPQDTFCAIRLGPATSAPILVPALPSLPSPPFR